MNMGKVAAIIQARVGSTRLPRKVLKKIVGKPMLWHVIERVKKARLIDEVVLATTTKKEDKVLLELAKRSGTKSYAGSEEDVLDRYFQAATRFGADSVVRVTSDCPLIDPEVVDKVVRYFFDGGFDYVSNTVKLSYPDGLDVEVLSFRVLKEAWDKARLSSEREHVTSYLKNHPEIFKIGSVENEEDLSHMRWTVDEERDLKFVREVYKRLYREGEVFYMRDVLDLLRKHPKLMEINKGIARDEGYLKSSREDRPVR